MGIPSDRLTLLRAAHVEASNQVSVSVDHWDFDGIGHRGKHTVVCAYLDQIWTILYADRSLALCVIASDRRFNQVVRRSLVWSLTTTRDFLENGQHNPIYFSAFNLRDQQHLTCIGIVDHAEGSP